MPVASCQLPVERHRPTRDLPPAPTLYLPLAQGREPPAEPRVSEGDRVHKGQLLAEPATPDAIAVHAPADAAVQGLTLVNTAHDLNVSAIQLEPIGTRNAELGTRNVESRTATVECDTDNALAPADLPSLHRAVTQAGVLLREPLPTLGDAKPEWLIVNALESELVQTVMYRTLSEHGPAVMAAAVRLAATLGARRACLVVDRKLGKRWPAGASPKTDTPPATARLRIVRLSAHYPAGATPLVIHSVTGREIPYLGRAADVGVFIIDPVALLHLGRAVDTSTPQTWQPVTVAGDAVQAPGCYRVPLGTPLAHIARKVGVTLSAAAPAIVGDLLSGGGLDWQTSPPSVLTKQDHTLIFQRPTLTVERLPVACIRCGECLDHCPVGLDPRAILDRVERRRLDQLAPLSPAACLDCGLCDFVCPSALPLMRAVQRARHHVHP